MKKKTDDKYDPRQALESPEVPTLYGSSFAIFWGLTDVSLVFEHNKQPAGNVSMSHTMAKSLMLKLGDLIREFEERVDIEIPTMDEIEAKLNDTRNGQDEKE